MDLHDINKIIDPAFPAPSRERLLDTLENVAEPEESEKQDFEIAVVETMRLLNVNEPDFEWCDQLVNLATRCRAEYVFWRTVHWEIEPTSMKSEKLLDRFIQNLRIVLVEGQALQRGRAARVLRSLGARWPEMTEDFQRILNSGDLRQMDLINVLSAAFRLSAIPDDEARHLIDRILEAADPDDQIWVIVAHHGKAQHWPYLMRHFQKTVEWAREETASLNEHVAYWPVHIALGQLISFAVRFPEHLDEVVDIFLSDQPFIVTSGWEHYLQRYSDSSKFVDKLVEDAFISFQLDLNTLLTVNRVKNCNRPSQLAHFQGCKVDRAKLESIRPIIEQSSGSSGVWATSESYNKESALSLATRLGLRELIDWEPRAVAHEEAPFLVKRLAEDCAFWGDSTFVTYLREKLRLPGEQNPVWLVDDLFGILNPREVFEIVLESDGRHGMDSALRDYAHSLGLLAASEGHCERLTKRINDSDLEDWRRHACAGGIWQAHEVQESVEIDLSSVCRYVENGSNPDWTRDELAIVVAIRDRQAFRLVVDRLDPARLDSSRMLLACTIAEHRLDEVKARLSKYTNPPPSPYTSSYQSLYGARTAGLAYSKGIITSTELVSMLRNGLRYEVDEAIYGIGTINHQDPELMEALWTYAITENTASHSRPSVWILLGRLNPEGLTQDRILSHVRNCSSLSVKYYLDALIEQRTKLVHKSGQIEDLLLALTRDRERSVAWYSAWVGSILIPHSVMNRIDILSRQGNQGIRSALEHAVWADDSVWDSVLALLGSSRFVVLEDYAEKLKELRDQLNWAESYIERVIKSDNLLKDWKYVQALLRLPSETVLLNILEYSSDRPWSPQEGRGSHLRNWLLEKLDKNLKKAREKLLEVPRLPGEEAFVRWF